MSRGTTNDRTRALQELDEATCWALLAGTPVGRLVWHGAEGLSVIVVNHAVDLRGERPGIRLHTTAYSAAARECDGSPVAFEVDRLEAPDRRGWSVLVRGTAEIDYPSLRGSAERDHDGVDVWPDGVRPLHLRILAQRISGRRLA